MRYCTICIERVISLQFNPAIVEVNNFLDKLFRMLPTQSSCVHLFSKHHIIIAYCAVYKRSAFSPDYQPSCIKLGGETDSAIRRRTRTGVTSPRGTKEALVNNFSETVVVNKVYFL